MERTPIQLPYNELSGMSQKLIDQHYNVLYKGYINKLTEIENKLENADFSTANATYSDLRELQRERVFAANAVRLHEGFFNCLGGSGGEADNQILDIITQDFGSYDNWASQFKASGLCSRGWVVLAYDHGDKKLHNYTTDIHSDGVWSCTPLLILDVYEHAYYLDYATNRKDYIESFFNNINWNYVNSMVQKFAIMQMRMAA